LQLSKAYQVNIPQCIVVKAIDQWQTLLPIGIKMNALLSTSRWHQFHSADYAVTRCLSVRRPWYTAKTYVTQVTQHKNFNIICYPACPHRTR